MTRRFYTFSILLFFLCTTNFSFSNSNNEIVTHSGKFNYDCIISSTLIEKSEACSIYMLEDENGNPLFRVIAAVATAWLPEIVEGFCQRTIGDPDICNAVFDVTSMVVTLRGKAIYRGLTRGLSNNYRWIANRGTRMSRATVEAGTYEVASGIKTVFELYKRRCSKGSIPWESVKESRVGDSFNASYHSFYTFTSCKFASITGNRVNFRTTPSIETYNKIDPQLKKGQSVSVLGYQIPPGGDDLRTTDYRTKFYYGNESFDVEKGIAVRIKSSYNTYYYWVELHMKNGESKVGRILKSSLSKMQNKKWFKIRANGRVGWVFEDFIDV